MPTPIAVASIGDIRFTLFSFFRLGEKQTLKKHNSNKFLAQKKKQVYFEIAPCDSGDSYRYKRICPSQQNHQKKNEARYVY
jgi:hypothetical protein